MKKKILVILTLLVFAVFMSACSDILSKGKDSDVLYVNIKSEPKGAEIFYRYASKIPEVKSSNRYFLGTTDYRGTKSISIPGLNQQNAAGVTLVITVEKKGYKPVTEHYNMAGLLNDLAISALFKLEQDR